MVTTVFSLLNGYLWRALPYQDAERVVSLAEVQPGEPSLRRIGGMPLAAYAALRAQAAER